MASEDAQSAVDHDAIAKLVKFYFSDSNFRHDRFLKEESAKDSEGFVKLSVLLTFNRLKSLTTDEAIVADVIATHDSLKGKVVLSDAKDAVRRANPLSEVDDSPKRTVFVDGFDVQGPEPTIDELVEVFKAFGEVNIIRKRRGGNADKTKPKRFLGQAFVEYESESSVEAIIAMSKAVGIKHNEKDLSIMPLSDWLNRKRKREPTQEQGASKTEKQAPEELKYETGLILKICDIPDGVGYNDIKKEFGNHGYVKFVEHKFGDPVGYVRFGTTEDCQKALTCYAENGVILKKSEDDKALVEDAKDSEIVEEDTEKAPQDVKDGEQKEESAEDTAASATLNSVASKVVLLEGDEEREFWARCRAAAKQSGDTKRRKKRRY